MPAINAPFVSEAYDRLIEAQEMAKADDVVLDTRHDAVRTALSEPVNDAAAFKRARVRLGLTQAEMGERLGIDAPRVSGMENGKPIDCRTDLAVRALLASALA